LIGALYVSLLSHSWITGMQNKNKMIDEFGCSEFNNDLPLSYCQILIKGWTV
jgi:hypothetical protein